MSATTVTPSPRPLLVAGDDPALRRTLAATLAAAELPVAEADTAAAAAACAAAAPALVLLDAAAAGSLDLCRRIKALAACDEPAIVALVDETASEAGLAELIAAGAADYLAKTASPALLLHRVGLLLRERARWQRLLAEKHDAEEAIALRDKFVALVAHDLRSPLSAILGLMEVVLEDNLPAGQEELLRVAHDSGQRLLSMVEQLLDIARLQTGKLTPHPEFVDGEHLASEIVRRLEHNAAAKGVVLENALPAHLRLYADRVMFGEVIQNLLSNAIKFSHPGGRVRLYSPAGSPATVAVSDDGVGIAPERQERLFRLEEKTSTVGTAGERGTGFGLPFSADILRAHGGTLTVDSDHGSGSTFFATLPEVRPRLLVVDDERLDRMMVTMLLGQLDIELAEAASGREALGLIPEFRPHLIVSDITMPEMDGFGLLQALAAAPATAAIPVIVLTGDDQVETRERAFRLGAADFTVKPVNAADLIPRVRRVIK